MGGGVGGFGGVWGVWGVWGFGRGLGALLQKGRGPWPAFVCSALVPPRGIHPTRGLYKHNGKFRRAATRLINSLDAFGKLHDKWLWSNTTSTAQRPYASGYATGKSRLAAIIQKAKTPLDDAGKLTPSAGSSARQLCEDTQLLSEHDDGYMLAQDLYDRPLLLHFFENSFCKSMRASYGADYSQRCQMEPLCPMCALGAEPYLQANVLPEHTSRAAIGKRKCNGRSSSQAFAIEPPQTLECSFFLRKHEHVESLLACSTDHAAGPYILAP